MGGCSGRLPGNPGTATHWLVAIRKSFGSLGPAPALVHQRSWSVNGRATMAAPRYSMVRNAVGDDGEMRLILSGEIDLASHEMLLSEIIQLVGGAATHLVIDLESVTFVDS